MALEILTPCINWCERAIYKGNTSDYLGLQKPPKHSLKFFIWLQLLIAVNGIKVLLILMWLPIEGTFFKLSHVLEEVKELKLLLLVITLVTLQTTVTKKSNRKEEIAAVYYSKESCIVILNLMEMYMLDIYKYCCLRVARVLF